LLDDNSNGYGPLGIAFIGCDFNGSEDTPKPNYALEDISNVKRRGIVHGCYFKKSNYATGITNAPLYAFKDCYEYVARG
jgi:hypothetical protein